MLGGFGEFNFMPKKWIGYKGALQRAVAMYEGVSQTKARQIIEKGVRELRAQNKTFRGTDLSRSPYREFEKQYFETGTIETKSFEKTVNERFENFLAKYGEELVSFKFQNKTYDMTFNEIIEAYSKGAVNYSFVKKALREFEEVNTEYIKGNYGRH